MIEKTPNLDTRGGARRRLVKGAFAAPAMLTLQSGGASAATSLGTCLAKRNLSPTQQPVAGSDDLWFRYELYGYVKNTDPTNIHNNAYWIQGADLVAFKRDGMTPWLASTSFQQFNITANTLVTPVLTAQPAGPGSSHTWKPTGKWVSLRVDGSGALKGAGASGGGSAMSDSCWNSFAMAPRP